MRIGIVGIGFMGMIHYLASKQLRDAKVVAIASRDPKKRAGDWTSIRGNFGPKGSQENLAGIRTYESAEELIHDPGVDLVDICLPGDLHADFAIKALQAGKHVLVEKPISLKSDSARKMVDAARQANRSLLVAHVLPFFPDFRFALEAVRSGKYGKPLAAHLRRHTSKRDWSDPTMDITRTGGPIIDLHIHDVHFIGLAFGRPKSVFSRGRIFKNIVDYVSTQYVFAEGGPTISVAAGSLTQPSREFTHGYEIYMEQGTLFYEGGSPVTLFTPKGVEHPEIPSLDPVEVFQQELQYAVDGLSGKGPIDLLDGSLACESVAICEKEELSVRTGKEVEL